MKTNDNLALFALGAVTLGVTFMFLFALSGWQSGGGQGTNNQIIEEIKRDLASLKRGDTEGAATAMAALDREISVTLSAAAEYLAGGTFDEKRHISLLERLQFYSGLSSISDPLKQTIASSIKDMERLSTLKESVTRQVRLSAEIDAAVTEAYLYISRDSGDRKEATRLLDTLEGLYRIKGLSSVQNGKLKSAIAAMREQGVAPEAVYRAADAPAPKPAPRADIPPVLKQYLAEGRGTQPTASAKPVQQVPQVPLEQDLPPEVNESQALSRIAGIAQQASTSVKSAPASKAVAAAPPVPFVDPARLEDTLSEVRRYLVGGEYDPAEHARLTGRLEAYVDIADEFTPDQLSRLLESHENMQIFEAAVKEFL